MNRTAATPLSIVFAAVATVCVGVVLYTWFDSNRGKARSDSCAYNLKEMGIALAQYAQDNNGTLPRAWYGKDAGPSSAANYKWIDAIYPYGTVMFPSNTQCPSDVISHPYAQRSGTNYGSYVYNNAHYASRDRFTPPAGQPLSRIADNTTVLVMDGENDFQFAWPDPKHAPSYVVANGLRLGAIVARHKGTPGTVAMTLWVDGSVHSNSLQSAAAEKVIHGQKIYTGFTIERD